LRVRLISVVGPPAVGKTTLAEHLAGRLPAELIREDYASNPFLAESYAGSEEARLPNQLFFLISRVTQLSILNPPQSPLLVSDYGFCQDGIFARVRLAAEDLRLYGRLARRLERLVRPPDLLVHLDACEETLLERIARRGRDFERVMNREFLSTMRKAYNEAAAEAGCDVVRINVDAEDLQNESALAKLVARVRERL
jgi:deoxyguanosine kinase